MKRRALILCTFLVFAAAVTWYASSFVDIPKLSFAQAMQINDEKKKVMIPGKVVAERQIQPEEGSVVFYMLDEQGKESRVLYDGEDALSAGQLADAAKSQKTISVAGHYCGDKFHAKSVFFPAY